MDGVPTWLSISSSIVGTGGGILGIIAYRNSRKMKALDHGKAINDHQVRHRHLLRNYRGAFLTYHKHRTNSWCQKSLDPSYPPRRLSPYCVPLNASMTMIDPITGTIQVKTSCDPFWSGVSKSERASIHVAVKSSRTTRPIATEATTVTIIYSVNSHLTIER
jgi:hypothetical protein